MIVLDQNSLRSWLGSELKALPIKASFLNHIVGMDRVLGTRFHEFFFGPYLIESKTALNYARLAIAARALTVFDDALRDGDSVGLSQTDLHKACSQLKKLTIRLITMFIGSSAATSLFEKREFDLQHTYKQLEAGATPEFNTVLGKCAYIHLPFDLAGFELPINTVEARRSEASQILFILQLADDCKDRLTDLNCNFNSNLFSWGFERSTEVKRFCLDRLACKVATITLIEILTQNIVHSPQISPLVKRWMNAVNALFLCFRGFLKEKKQFANCFGTKLPFNYKVPNSDFQFPWNALSYSTILETMQISAESIHIAATKETIMNATKNVT